MKCLIAYFSGTGTTEAAVRMLRDGLEASGCGTRLARMEDILLGREPMPAIDAQLLGIASPVLEFGTPRVVKDFVRALPDGAGRRTFILRTAGGVGPQNYGASKSLIRALRRKGYLVFHERLFSIASNWVTKFSPAAVAKLYEATRRKTALMAADLLAGRERFLEAPIGTRLLMGTIAFLGARSTWLVGKDFRVSGECTMCGICVRGCPRGNISERKGKIAYGTRCICCMRCAYSCPRKAIGLKLFSFFAVPGGFRIEKAIEEATAASPSIEGYSPPFLPAYVRDDAL
jgi:ferredoxin